MNGGAERSAVVLERPAAVDGITPRLAEILAMMVEAVLDAEDAAVAARGMVAVTTPTGVPSRPVPIGGLRAEKRKESA